MKAKVFFQQNFITEVGMVETIFCVIQLSVSKLDLK